MFPKQDNVQIPLLKVLSEHPDGLSAREAAELTLKYYDKITDEDRRMVTNEFGWPLLYTRVHWARFNLIEMGELDDTAPRGIWKISEKGKQRLERDLKKWKPEYSQKTPLQKTDELDRDDDLSEKESKILDLEENPYEKIGDVAEKITATVKEELLRCMRNMTPAAFENFVAEIFKKMGYHNVKVTQYSKDGGLDIECSLNELGFGKIIIQVKKWKDSSVGSKLIDELEGVRSKRRANSAVFVTLSTFTAEAQTAAEKVNMTLIGGTLLAEHCIKYKVGITHQALNIPSIDENFFDKWS